MNLSTHFLLMSKLLVKPSDLFGQCIRIASKYVENHDALKPEVIDKAKGVFSFRNSNDPIEMTGKPCFYLLRVKNTKADM